MVRFRFTPGAQYTRKDIRKAVGLDPDETGGDWATGYTHHGGADFIFCAVGTSGRTGHNYGNGFDDTGRLHWSGKTRSHIGQPSIQRMLAVGAEVHIFWRANDRDSFTYAGLGQAEEVVDETPVKVIWSFNEQPIATTSLYPDEVQEAEQRTYSEGSLRTVKVNSYERDSAAREACVQHFGAVCQACDSDFSKIYGEMGSGFIHVHHRVPLASIGEKYSPDPVKDLVPVCPNCHAMLHRQSPPLEVEQLKVIVDEMRRRAGP